MTQADWDDYESSMNIWQEDAFQETITWHKSSVSLSKHGEDNNERFRDFELKAWDKVNKKMIFIDDFRISGEWNENKFYSGSNIYLA